jgi:hypothetical protein
MFYFKELQTISHQALADLKLVKIRRGKQKKELPRKQG